MVNNNSNTTSLLPSDTSLLELGESESTTLTDLAVVADGLATDGGTKEREGADTESGGLGLAGIASAQFTPWLVEPSANTALPVLAEVVSVEDCKTR